MMCTERTAWQMSCRRAACLAGLLGGALPVLAEQSLNLTPADLASVRVSVQAGGVTTSLPLAQAISVGNGEWNINVEGPDGVYTLQWSLTIPPDTPAWTLRAELFKANLNQWNRFEVSLDGGETWQGVARGHPERVQALHGMAFIC